MKEANGLVCGKLSKNVPKVQTSKLCKRVKTLRTKRKSKPRPHCFWKFEVSLSNLNEKQHLHQAVELEMKIDLCG